MGAVLTATVAVGFLAHAPAAWACSCVAHTLEQRYQAAEFVFNGVVEHVETAGDSTRARIVLDEIFKGRLPSELEVTTASTSAACGVPFVGGIRYTVFATQDVEDLATSACDGTTEDPAVRAGARDIATAGQAAASIEPGSTVAMEADPAADRTSRAGPIAAAALIAAAVMAGVIWVRLVR